MRVFTRSVRIYGSVVIAAAVVSVLVQVWAQPPGSSAGRATSSRSSHLPSAAALTGDDTLAQVASGPPEGGLDSAATADASAGGFGMPSAATNRTGTYAILTGDNQIERFEANRVYDYSMEAGAAKPRRVRAGGQSQSSGSRMGMGAMPGMSGMEQNDKSWPTIQALVFDESDWIRDPAAQPNRAAIKVVVYSSEFGAAMGEEAMMGSPGVAMPSSDMAMASGIMEIDTKEAGVVRHLPPLLQKVTEEERANIAQLIRLDVWIEDARSALSVRRNDSKAFAVAESHLKKLLSEEYDALLTKQRSDVELLHKRLAKLQADLERRAEAKDRVVEVQLGKLVLEAQGLLDTER